MVIQDHDTSAFQTTSSFEINRDEERPSQNAMAVLQL